MTGVFRKGLEGSWLGERILSLATSGSEGGLSLRSVSDEGGGEEVPTFRAASASSARG